MTTFLVTGASRGLGLHLVRVLSTASEYKLLSASTKPKPEPPALVIAASRSAEPSADLAAVIAEAKGHVTVKHVQLEVDKVDSIKRAASEVSTLLDGAGLDYLICNAAVRDPEWELNIEKMDYLPDALATNASGTHELIRAFLPELRRGRAKKIVLFSSTLGCITVAQTDPSIYNVGFPAYKISKAATHMLAVLWSNHLKGDGFTVYLQSPGNLKTKLAGDDKADLPIEVGAREVLRIAYEAQPQDTGRHRNIHVKGWENGGGVGGRYDGKDLFW